MNRFPSIPPDRWPLVALLFIGALAWPTARALGCACCADPGTREESTENITDYYRTQLRGMEFAPEARLFMTDAGDDQVKGVSAIADSYRLTAKQDDKRWQLTFQTENGEKGTLTLPIPAKFVIFHVDPRDGKKSGGGGPLLYKEWRWKGVPVTDGIFKKGALRYSLVLQGRGNRCDNGYDFTHWHLEVSGKNIAYTLYGAFVQEEKEAEGNEVKEEKE
jgi:hypothetical protein